MISIRAVSCGLLVLVAVASQVQAKLMRVPIDFKVTLKANELSVKANGTSGFPINLAKFEVVVVNAQSTAVSVPLRESATGGTYVGRVPTVKPGNVTFVIRDVTFPEQILKVEQAAVWPLNGTLSLLLTPPPREPVRSGPSWSLLFVAALGLAVVAGIFVKLRSNK